MTEGDAHTKKAVLLQLGNRDDMQRLLAMDRFSIRL